MQFVFGMFIKSKQLLNINQRHYLSHFPQPLTPNLHPAESKPFLAQVLQRGPDRIDGVVEAEETFVGIL